MNIIHANCNKENNKSEDISSAVRSVLGGTVKVVENWCLLSVISIDLSYVSFNPVYETLDTSNAYPLAVPPPVVHKSRARVSIVVESSETQ